MQACARFVHPVLWHLGGCANRPGTGQDFPFCRNQKIVCGGGMFARCVNSTTQNVICIVLNKQHWSHKYGCQYIQHNSALHTHHNCDSGTLLTTQHTHFCLILCLILRGGRVTFVSPNMRRDMLP